jgi:SNF2 family DNA or RNA helicase
MKPLSAETAKLFQPIHLTSCDRMRVELLADPDGKQWFLVTPYQVRYTTVLVVKDSGVRHPINNLRDLETVVQQHGGHANVTIEQGEKRMWPSYPALNWMSRIPERRKVETGVRDGFQSWVLAATDLTAAVITTLWPLGQLKVAEDAQIVIDYLVMTTERMHENAETYAAYKATGQLPSTYACEEHPERPLLPYQRVALHNASRSEGYALFMEQGTGKTPIAIARVCNDAKKLHREQGRAYRALVVCPKNVRSNWASEFGEFATQKGRVTAVRGGQVRRFQQLCCALATKNDEVFTVCIISLRAMELMQELYAIEWDLVIIDEGHNIKSPSTQQTRNALKLRDHSFRRMLLTGTPICNSPMDLWAQFEFLGQGWSGFLSHKSFKEFYGTWVDVGDGFDKLVGLQNLPFMRERLARQSFMITKKEALPYLPEKLYDIHEVDMTAHQRDVYDQVRRDLVAQIENELGSSRNRAIVVQNVLTMLLRLAQITSGYYAYEEEPDTADGALIKGVQFFDPCPKIDAVAEIMREKSAEEKTIVWTCWVPTIHKLSERLHQEGHDHVVFYGSTSDDAREDAMRRFNEDPTCRCLIGNAAAGGSGVNLRGYDLAREAESRTNVTQVLYYSQNWSAIHRAQSEDRCHGKNRCRVPIRYTDLCVPGTIDEEIRTRVTRKRMMALEVSDIREIVRSILTGVIGDE